MNDRSAHEYPVIHKMYRLALEYTQRVRRFPRDTRFVLGDRILLNCYAILEGLVAARSASRPGCAGILESFRPASTASWRSIWTRWAG